MKKIVSSILPFIFLGIMIVVFLAGIVIFSYVLIFGALIGFILFLISFIKERLFGKQNENTNIQKKPKAGRTINHDDL